jgi:hypothetical protein
MYRRNRLCRTSRPYPVTAPRERFDSRDWWLRADAQGARVLFPPRRPGHGCTAVPASPPAMIVDGRQKPGVPARPGSAAVSAATTRLWGYSQISPRLHKIGGPPAVPGGVAAYGEHRGLPGQASGTALRE